MVLTAGMGGTGTGITPVIARIAKNITFHSWCTVTKPFQMEGKKIEKPRRVSLNYKICQPNCHSKPKYLCSCKTRYSVTDSLQLANTFLMEKG